ncbi:MAG: GNAT family N-acetyltransferase [Acidiferrobacterales bacterium]|nr:GNAT family N-acetyltransferase [Acidiferrobacterales bacterium]
MTFKNNQPQAVSQVFFLRPIEQSDLDAVANWYQQLEDVSIFDRQVPLPINRDEVQKIISSQIRDREDNKCYWFIVEDEQHKPIGMTGLELVNNIHGNAILPVFVDNEWRRSGIGIRMVCLMLEMAFKQLRLHKIATVYRADNAATATLVERCGFTTEGVAREAWFAKGEHFDLINVGILAREWEQTRVKLSRTMDSGIRLCLGPRATPDWCWPISDK